MIGAIKENARKLVPASLRPFFVRQYLGMLRLFYSGDAVCCTVCGKTFRKFLTFSSYGKTRKNARCPGCGSLERHRYISDFLGANDLLKPGIALLHFAPEPALIKKFKTVTPHYFSADLFSPLAEHKVDIMNIPFGDASMDLVVCLHVMNHVPDDAKGYSELFRVLKPGGSLVLQAGVDKSLAATDELPPGATDAERTAKFGQVDLFRIYAGDIAERVTRHGFTFREETARNRYSPEELQRKGILPGDFIFYCRKP